MENKIEQYIEQIINGDSILDIPVEYRGIVLFKLMEQNLQDKILHYPILNITEHQGHLNFINNLINLRNSILELIQNKDINSQYLNNKTNLINILNESDNIKLKELYFNIVNSHKLKKWKILLNNKNINIPSNIQMFMKELIENPISFVLKYNEIEIKNILDEILMNILDFSLPFRVNVKNIYTAQSFEPDMEEKAIILYPDIELVKKLTENDPIMLNFFLNYPGINVHFINPIAPLGWALVYETIEDNEKIWVINQIQTDIVIDLKKALSDIDKSSDEFNKNLTFDDILNNVEIMEKLTQMQRDLYIHFFKQYADQFDIHNEQAKFEYIMRTQQELRKYKKRLYENIFVRNQLTKLVNDILHDPEFMYNFKPVTNIREVQNNLLEMDEQTKYYLVNEIATIALEKERLLRSMSKDELEHIKNKISNLIKNWHIYVFDAVWRLAKKENVKYIYMNTSQTVHQGFPSKGRHITYELYPKDFGFSSKMPYKGDQTRQLWKRLTNKKYKFIRY